MYRGWLDDRAVGFVIVNSWLLMKTLLLQVKLLAFNHTIGVTLDVKYPFATNKVLIWSGGNNGPGVVFNECIKLKVHSLPPLGVFGCGSETS